MIVYCFSNKNYGEKLQLQNVILEYFKLPKREVEDRERQKGAPIITFK